MNLPRKRRIAVLTALAILLFAGSALAVCTSHSKDSDHDGIPNCIEKRLRTNPHSADTDHDGLSDGLSDGMEAADGRDPSDGEDGDDQDQVHVKIKSPVASVDSASGMMVLLGGRLTVNASHADFEGVDDLAALKSRVDGGATVMVKVKIDPASLAGGATGPALVATKVEVDGGEDGDAVRCCLPGSGVHDDCDQQSASDCSDAGGLNMGHGSCEPNPCP